jgi:hypothetical protein
MDKEKNPRFDFNRPNVKSISISEPNWAPMEPGASSVWRKQWSRLRLQDLPAAMTFRTFMTINGVIPIFLNRDEQGSIASQSINVVPYQFERGKHERLPKNDPTINAFVVDNVAALVTVTFTQSVRTPKVDIHGKEYYEETVVSTSESVMLSNEDSVTKALVIAEAMMDSDTPMSTSTPDMVVVLDSVARLLWGDANSNPNFIRPVDLKVSDIVVAAIGRVHSGACYPQVTRLPKGTRSFVTTDADFTLAGAHFIIGVGGSGKTPLAWCLYWLAHLYATIFADGDSVAAGLVNDGPPLYAVVNEPVGHSDDVDSPGFCSLTNGAHARKACLFVADSERREISLPSAPLPEGIEKPATQRGGLNPLVLEAFIHRVSRAMEAVGMPTVVGMAPATDDDSFKLFLGAVKAVAGEMSEVKGRPQANSGKLDEEALTVSMEMVRTRHRSQSETLPVFSIKLGAILAASTGTSRMYHASQRVNDAPQTRTSTPDQQGGSDAKAPASEGGAAATVTEPRKPRNRSNNNIL